MTFQCYIRTSWQVTLCVCVCVCVCLSIPPCTLEEGCVTYKDLATIEWLFGGSGDHQFDVYRMMREETK